MKRCKFVCSLCLMFNVCAFVCFIFKHIQYLDNMQEASNKAEAIVNQQMDTFKKWIPPGERAADRASFLDFDKSELDIPLMVRVIFKLLNIKLSLFLYIVNRNRVCFCILSTVCLFNLHVYKFCTSFPFITGPLE